VTGDAFLGFLCSYNHEPQFDRAASGGNGFFVRFDKHKQKRANAKSNDDK
jgi:hypothetical protein